MQKRTIGLLTGGLLIIVLVLATASAAFAVGPFGSNSAGPTATAGGYGPGGYGPGGMMGRGYGAGPGGAYGNGSGYGPGGMMGGGWGQTNPTGPTISLAQAQQNVQSYLNQLGNSDLAIDEVMEFQDNFYAIVKEKSTGVGAFEVLINKGNGVVTREPGPDMMWNTKYGMWSQSSPMGQWMGYYPSSSGAMTVSVDQAKQFAQAWLDQYQPGSTTETPDQFYGYYTVHTLKDGKVTGMLSVNGYTGQVWYHTWHGAFIQMKDLGQ